MIRKARPDDLDQLVRLHERVWPEASGAADHLRSYLRRLIFEGPYSSRDYPSLFAVDDDGKVLAFIGLIRRPWRFRQEPVDSVTTHTFMADPEARSSPFAAVQLLRTVLSGPQDLTLAQGTDVSARIWRRLGGGWSPVLSMRWIRVLRPVRYLTRRLQGRGRARWMTSLLSAPSRLADAAAASVLPGGSVESGGGKSRTLALAELAPLLAKVASARSLTPHYDSAGLAWMIDALAYRKDRGELRMASVDLDGTSVGWFIYYRVPRGVAQVVQVGAAPGREGAVLRALFAEAREAGADAVEGLMDPPLMREYSAAGCFFRSDHSTFLLHARDESLAAAVRSGDCFLSRMEGEWWIGVDPTPPASATRGVR